MARKLTEAQIHKVTHTNWGYWDGVADRGRNRLAPWYKGAAEHHGHFDPDYAAGYDTGIFAGNPPPHALG